MIWRRAVVAVALTGLAVGRAGALETDQYYAWSVPLEDATAALNAKINYEIVRAIATAAERSPQGTPSCSEITREFRRRIDFVILQPIEVWVTHSPLVPRLPATPEEELSYRHSNIYGNFGPFDIGRWVPDSPTVEVNGVRFGTDKISHFFSSGWRYRAKYLEAKANGLSDDQAVEQAVRHGVFEESTGMGLLVDGVFSRGDLEANLSGMRFYLSVCDGSDPLLSLERGRWELRRPFDWREHVTPGWDESYNVSMYSASRWRKVRPQLLEHCDHRHDPRIVEQMASYETSYRPSPNDAVVEELVRNGKLPDPASFTLDAICPPVDAEGLPPANNPRVSSPLVDPPASQPLDEQALIAEIAAREADRARRTYALAGAALTSYGGPAASLGWLFTSVEADFDCHTICDLRGTTLQIEPGLDGGQLSFGYARVFGETGRHERFMPKTYLAYGVKGLILRTWNDGDLGPSGLNFMGLQGQFTVTSVSFKLGALWHVGSGRPRHSHAITWSVGWGF